VSRSATLARRLMDSAAVPLVYTRYWRPLLGRVAKGLGGPSMAEEFSIAARMLDLHPGDLVLDIGCGPGTFTCRFADAVAPDGLALGLDASPTMLARARREGAAPAAAYLRADAGHPPLRPGCLDAVCCFAALHMFAEPEAALESFVRLLRPGGRLALLTTARRPNPVGFVDDALGQVSGQRMFGRDEIVDQLAGLNLEGITRQVAGVAQFVGARVPAAQQ
jgi:SAM-dependent methyltransferase